MGCGVAYVLCGVICALWRVARVNCVRSLVFCVGSLVYCLGSLVYCMGSLVGSVKC